jgi:hypothetical protein
MRTGSRRSISTSQPIENVKLRASYSHTITRADYASLQGGRTLDTQPAHRWRHGQPGQSGPGSVQVEEYRCVGRMVLFARQLRFGRIFPQERVELTSARPARTRRRSGCATPVARSALDQAAVAALGTNDAVRDPRLYPAQLSGFVAGHRRRADNLYLTATSSACRRSGCSTSRSRSRSTATRPRIAERLRIRDPASASGTPASVSILNYTIVNGDAVYDNEPALIGRPVRAYRSQRQRQRGPLLRQGRICRRALRITGATNSMQAGRTRPMSKPMAVRCQRELRVHSRASPLLSKAINLTGEGPRGHRRTENNVTFVSPGFARYAAGVRFSF